MTHSPQDHSTAVIPACIILDDFPINGSYWTREQQTAFGFTPNHGGDFGREWRNQARAAWCSPETLERFADLCDEFGVRGKFTVLPCPAGLGRIDRTVRGCDPSYIERLLDTVRRRIAHRFDLTPEVLTHSMAYDPDTGAMLPHTESAYLSHLAATRQTQKLHHYVHTAWSILDNVGLKPSGITIGGIPDKSGIANNQMFYDNHNRDVLAEVMMEVLREFQPGARDAFMYAYGSATREPYITSLLPEPVWSAPDGGRVYEIISPINEPLVALMHGDGDINKEADKLITPDLAAGAFIKHAQAGQPIVMTIHAQTITSLNTHHGLHMLAIALRRLHERYGSRVKWMTPLELCVLSHERHG